MPILMYSVRASILYHVYFLSRVTYGIIFWLTDSYSEIVVCLQKKVMGWIFRIEERASCNSSFNARKILTVASIYIFRRIMFL